MTFGRQVRWALARRLLLAVAGVVLTFVAIIFEVPEMPEPNRTTGFLAIAFIALGAALQVLGGVPRSIQRWAFLRGMSGRREQLGRPVGTPRFAATDLGRCCGVAAR